jgi:hypothetical protein
MTEPRRKRRTAVATRVVATGAASAATLALVAGFASADGRATSTEPAPPADTPETAAPADLPVRKVVVVVRRHHAAAVPAAPAPAARAVAPAAPAPVPAPAPPPRRTRSGGS